MQREDKQLDVSMEVIMGRLNDLRNSIKAMIFKLETEYETINWPSFLDNFGLISSHLTGLTKILSKDSCPPLRNRTFLPLIVSMDRDENLVNLTEGRVSTFSHDIVPDYLRTKPDLQTGDKMMLNEQKAANLSAEAAMKQVAQYNKVVSHVLDMVCKAREEWEIESSSRSGLQQTSSMSDTHALVAAVGIGKGLKIGAIVPGPGGPGGMMVPPNIRAPAPMNTVSPGGVGPMAKAPSAIKTNIKSAMQVHPFSR